MALTANSVIEVRADTGSDLNGGAYDSTQSGATTDYTYPTSSPISYTDLTVQSTTTKLSSVSRPAVAADIGNTFCIGGNRYVVVSVAAGVWTLNASAGTSGQVLSGVLGGALATWNTGVGAMALGNTLYLRNGSGTTYGVTTTPSAVNVGSITYRTRILGYGTTRGDNGTPTVQLQASSTSIISYTGGFQYEIRNIIFDLNSTSGSNNYGINMSSATAVVIRECSFINIVSGGHGIGLSSTVAVDIKDCGFVFTQASSSSNAYGIAISNAAQASVSYCSFSGIGYGYPVDMSANAGQYLTMRRCLINATDRTRVAGGSSVEFCDFYNTSGTALLLQANGTYVPMVTEVHNNIFATTGGYGMDASGSYASLIGDTISGNAFYSCTSGAHSSNIPATTSADVTLTANPFNNAGSGDFSLNSTSGGGAACKAVAWPSTINGATNYLDMGMLQSHASGGASGGGPILGSSIIGRARRTR